MEPLAPSSSSSSKKPPIDPSPAAAAADDDGRIWTPEKPPQLPRRSRNRSLAFSVKEVKQAPLRLQRTEKGSGSDAAGADLGRSDDALSFVERQLLTESDRRSSPLKPKPQIRLPEKNEILCKFFNSMESSIRLLRLKGSMLTFPSICTSIQHLTERRFTYEHLAQIKHILSEAILIKKVLLRYETTCCMKPELQITLQLEAGDEIPVAELPHPFNRSKPSEIATSEPRAITDLQFAESPSISSPLHQPVVLSHMSQSFRKRFSQKKDALPDSCTTSFACIRSASQRDDPPVSLLPSSKQSVPKPPVITKSLQSSPISMKKVEGIPAKAMRKEYSQARFLSIAQAQFLRAPDEIKMSTSRLRLKETEDEPSAIIWNDVLGLLELLLVANGVMFVRMKGGRKSQVALAQFKGDISVVDSGKTKECLPVRSPFKALLMLIQHGANGLNLLEAQHVILVEPLLNLAAEAQAITGSIELDRARNIYTPIHREG
uniref:CDT1 Geminin-binding domain-containing protein n=1 Tax=Ananas comosus var. bracteatus TaxID=296719 RepID=A0A6V7Q1Z2_ANACO|nr:unnamed protein product [Ananas comosus var. bracteatus]